jgi:RNA polymerase sigma-70 factor (ECF subfamily)
MPEANGFQDLIRRVRSGDEEAAAELVRTYEPAIRREARVRLVDTRLRRLFDSMDICQSVFSSFFVRAAMGQYELDEPAQLMRLLTAMSRKKLIDHARAHQASRRDHRRLRPGSQDLRELCDASPSPSQQVAGQELIREFRKRLSAEERALADERALNREWAQIAADQGGTPEALRKKLSRAVDRVAQEMGLDEPDDA